MTKFIQKIDKQITALQGKIEALSGNYLTNTWKRQREQQERDRKKEILRSQLQVLEYLKQKAEAGTLCEHIQKAFDFVRPGGSLVAVCSNCIQWKSTRKYEQFRDWLAEHTHSVTESRAKFEMTGVHTVVLVMDKAA